ncbi:PIN domain-containing protein [Cryomorphaceae bacterium 1068]|nr:PIN domain-containing protein [Cryomorphaceae bacterium 1068]
MKVLLDTNIVIHREASRVVNHDIGQLFNWLDKLKHTKCVHPLTALELSKHKDGETVETMQVKLSSYHFLKTEAPIDKSIQDIIDTQDKNENDIIDSKILNELINERVDCIISEDKGITRKAISLGVEEKVFNIDRFLEKAITENPSLIDYNVLSVQKKFFGAISVKEEFFDSFREDYPGFDSWFKKKSDEEAYVCTYDGNMGAFLYLKVEDEHESYADIQPQFGSKKRLKIGTLKVTLNGLRLGERFLKIVFDNALKQKVDEIYVTIFDKRPGQKLLIRVLEQFGFTQYGTKDNGEIVLVKDFSKKADKENPRLTFPFLPRDSNIYFTSIRPEYHTELFPDSILRNESADDYIENEPHRNAISKVYVSHAYERQVQTGDVLLFYRTGGYYAGVATTVAIVESVIDNIQSEAELIDVCQKRTVLSKEQLKEFWNKHEKLKPFVINLLYSYSIPRRPNLKRLIELGVIEGVDKIPRGFGKLTWEQLERALRNK